MDEQRRWKLGHFRLSDQILGFTVVQLSSAIVQHCRHFDEFHWSRDVHYDFWRIIHRFNSFRLRLHFPFTSWIRISILLSRLKTFTHPLVLYFFFYSHWLLDKSVSRRIGRPSTTGEWVADLCWWLLFCTISLTLGMFNELWGRVLIHLLLFLYTNSPSYHFSPASSPGPPRKPKSHWRRRVFHSNTPRVPRLFYLPFLFLFHLVCPIQRFQI